MIIPGKEWEEFVFLLQEERTRTEQNRETKKGRGREEPGRCVRTGTARFLGRWNFPSEKMAEEHFYIGMFALLQLM